MKTEEIEKLSEEELEAKLSEFESAAAEPEKTPEGQVNTDNSVEVDDEVVEQPVENIVKPEEKTETNPKEVAPEGQVKPKEDVLTDEIISSFDPEEQKYLEKFRDKPIKEALKSLANAQKLIGKKRQELITPDTSNNVKPQVNFEDARKIKQDLVINELKRKFPTIEIPTLDRATEEYKLWASDLNYNDPDTFNDFRQELQRVTQEVEKDYNSIADYRENYPTYNQTKIENSVKQIESYFKDQLGVNLKDYGVDLNLSDGSNAILDALLNDPNAVDNDNLDPEIISFGKVGTPLQGLPFVNEKALINKFIQTYGVKIYKDSIAKARAEAVQLAQSKDKPTILPSLSGSGVKGQQKKTLTLQDIEQITDDHKIEEMLDELEKAS